MLDNSHFLLDCVLAAQTDTIASGTLMIVTIDSPMWTAAWAASQPTMVSLPLAPNQCNTDGLESGKIGEMVSFHGLRDFAFFLFFIGIWGSGRV